jgi:hypothetical protein
LGTRSAKLCFASLRKARYLGAGLETEFLDVRSQTEFGSEARDTLSVFIRGSY